VAEFIVAWIGVVDNLAECEGLRVTHRELLAQSFEGAVILFVRQIPTRSLARFMDKKKRSEARDRRAAAALDLPP